MKVEIKHVGVVQSGKVFAGIYLILAIPMVAFMLLASSFAGEAGSMGIGGAIGLAILYPLLGFISGVIGAWLYNIVAARIGGFQYTTAEA